jgi:ABC-type transport system involved in cytochrome bd biosynthesis fused ATPase/permease subunit
MHSLLALGALVIFIILNTLSLLCSRSMEVEVESKKRSLIRQIAELKREAALICTPSTFAASAKAQRKVNQLEKELESLGGGNYKEGGAAHARDKVIQAVKIIKIVVSAGLLATLFGSPVLFQVVPGVLPAFTSLAPFAPYSKDYAALGYVTVLPWLFFANRFSLMVGAGIAHWFWPDSSSPSSSIKKSADLKLEAKKKKP